MAKWNSFYKKSSSASSKAMRKMKERQKNFHNPLDDEE